MGIGSFNDGKFDFVVAATHRLTAAEKSSWQALFLQASRLLFEATEGQLSFGKIFFADDGWGLGTADFTLHSVDGTSYATRGEYGRLGRSVQLFASVRSSGDGHKTLVHEFGHHAFGLGDEYAGPVLLDDIDHDQALANFDPAAVGYPVVPLVDAAHDPALLDSAYAMLTFDGQIHRLIVASYDGQLSRGTSLTPHDGPNVLRVVAGFNQSPHLAAYGVVFFQPQLGPTTGFQIRCATDSTSNFCLMDNYKTRPSISEFCSADNHDPDGDTSHHALHGASCWEVLQQTMLERYDHAVAVPNPATSGHVDPDYPHFFDLKNEARIALVLDRSGSMNADHKIDGARIGVEQWINIAAEVGDFLSVSWFNDTVSTTLPLTEFTDPAAVAAGVQEAIGPNPVGWTNIRDGLFEAIDQIESRADRAAVQAVVLLTDGLHNRPLDTSLLEAVPSLQAAGIAVYVIALGGPETLDLDQLERLALDTGGTISNIVELGQSTDPDMQRAVITVEMVRVDGILRHGLVSVDENNVEGLAPDDPAIRRIRRPGSPALRTVLNWYDAADLTALRGRRDPVTTVRFHVEDGAERARFTIVYGMKERFRLVLVDPDGATVPFDGDRATVVDPDSPFTTAFVERPEPGEWTAIIARTAGTERSTVRHVATVENRRIVVRADCDRDVPAGSPVRITAGARWGDALSNLHVTARLVGPNGQTHLVDLSDDHPTDPGSGDYVGYFQPTQSGRYQGSVTIRCRGKAHRAGALHRAMHDTSDAAAKDLTIDLTLEAPPFVRQAPIYFDVGGRPEAKDLDGDSSQVRPPVRTRTTGLTPLPRPRIPKRATTNIR